MNNHTLNTKKVALNGILGALAVTCLVLATVMPVNRLSFYALSSFFVAVVIVESGSRAGWIFYAATSLLSLMVVPEKLGIVPYVIFFGIYGIVKYYVEKLNKIIPEYAIKFVYFNVCVGVALLTVSSLFGNSIVVKLPWGLVVIALEIIFFIYDFVYTLFINYYRDKLRPRLRL